MKVKISTKQNLKVFFITFFVCGVILFLCCMNLFIFTRPWTFVQYLIIGAYLFISLLFLFFSFKYNYYLIEKDCFEVHRFGQIQVYDYKNIIYIDQEESLKSKNVCFITSIKKTPRYLAFDKDNVLYETLLKKCPNLMSKEEFNSSFPYIKF